VAEDQLLQTVQNIDARLMRVEQILPGLATREELQASIAPLATREEMHIGLRAVIDQLRAEIKEEGERSRRYTDVLIEDLHDDNRLILEHLIALSARVDALAQR
jgi:hypothetical protein